MPKSIKHCIEFSGVSFLYGDNEILRNVTFSVNEGDYLGIIGPNGGGKSTLLKVLLGLLKPQKGVVKIFGETIDDFREKYRIGYVPQRIAQGDVYFPATVEEVVKSGRIVRRGLFRPFSQKDIEEVNTAIRAAGIEDIRHELIGDLSGGQKQRVFIARALAGNPRILILDEPVVGVDIQSQGRFYAFLKKINKDMGLTIIFVSHDIDAVAHEVTSIMCLNHSLISHGSTQEVLTDSHLKELYGKDLKLILHPH